MAGKKGGEGLKKRGRACVVVLGDIGHSPRMQYHALSLARQASLEVDIVAYGGSEPHKAVLEHQSIHIHQMKQWPRFLQALPKMLYPLMLLLKPLFQFLMLLWFLCIKIPAPDVFLVQNPPSIPTLVAVKWASWLRNARFIVDWHNFGYTLLALSLGRSGRFVALYRWFERRYGKMANGALCVTRAMQHELTQNWGIKTPDEDFSILLEAAVMYDRRVAAMLNEKDSTEKELLWKEMHDGRHYSYPRLLFVITGKGPEKEKYEEKIRRLNLKRVAFRTMWLSAEDYPLLLGSADLGVCLHTSSSGLDLPMKVVDMFGCGLPVCAVAYSCIKELVKVEQNGLLFSSSSELADELMMLFKGFPDECDSLKLLRSGALEMVSSRWDTEWEEHAKPLISEVMSRNSS
ncbi:chitobiosyldiphosphodolichol beta-mannosyltransferase-like isoform X7 [Tripterygium wilfordii]|uniref:Chitobiosyldiphosphodolichol beta-mannosyltransferase-like isoform X7 n=1 Tax=Tripterygium wilfordii TaxID=458696 RepID=A0A7J7C5U8_TRIWF|nr:chitobiosyldiphosphodolichol beta-mannosyltransferase-like isoform X7 [Tripterygium wilfordii]